MMMLIEVVQAWPFLDKIMLTDLGEGTLHQKQEIDCDDNWYDDKACLVAHCDRASGLALAKTVAMEGSTA